MKLFKLRDSNRTNLKFNGCAWVLVALALGCFAISPMAQAVNPPPDGGFPNFTTAEGDHALQSLTAGVANTGLGWSSLLSITTGSFNTGVGAATLALNTADSNTAIGAAALFLNTTGTNNTATGVDALALNNIGTRNTANGALALSNNTTGSFNTAMGESALLSNATGNGNTAIGDSALFANTTDNNTAIGQAALSSNTTGTTNTAIGGNALTSNTTAVSNTAIGFAALGGNTTGSTNTATGSDALTNNTTGVSNTAIGTNALAANTTGGGNVALGFNAGHVATTGINNVYIGAQMNGVAGESNACYIASIDGQTSASGVAVLINSSGRLGTTTSSKRFKQDIKPMDNASETLFALQPVTFRYKKELDPQGIQQWGLVAEDVQRVNPALVALDKQGRPYSVRYDQVNAMLLNEFLKEHKTVQEQGAIIARQQKQIDALTSGLQKMSAELELNKPASQTALNNE